MSKIVKKTLFTFLFVFIFATSAYVYAGTAYVNDMQIEAKVDKNGSMDVKETILFGVNDSLNGFYRDIKIQGNENTDGASSLIINEVKVDGEIFKYAGYTLYNGARGEYNVNNIANGKQVKIFVPTINSERTVEISYKLYDVVTVYDDIAEVYWNFIGDEWDHGMHKAQITIELPDSAGIPGKDLRVWAHGPLNGSSKIVDDRTVQLTIENLGNNTAVDARVTFPKGLVPGAVNRKSGQKLDSIISNESRLADEANKKRITDKVMVYAAIIISTIAFVMPIIMYIGWKRKTYKAKFNGEYYRELPEDYGPAVMNECIGNTVIGDRYNMQATLLDLVRRGYVSIEEYTIKKVLKDKKDYKLKLIKDDLSELNEHEKKFITTLIFVEGNEMTLEHLNEVSTATTKTQTKAYKSYTNWKDEIEKVAISKGIFKETNNIKNPKWLYIPLWYALLFVLLLIFKVFAFIEIVPLGFVIAFIYLMEYILLATAINKYYSTTEKCIEHKSMWKAFKKFLTDFSNMQDYDEKSLVMWEHYLVYATGLGIAEKVVKNLKMKFPDIYNDDASMMEMGVLYLCINTDSFNSFNTAFNSMASTAFSSPSSGSGGGGGFSGGGGGGRRRWRRWRLLSKKLKQGTNIYFVSCFLLKNIFLLV